jgi:hypothetical protein
LARVCIAEKNSPASLWAGFYGRIELAAIGTAFLALYPSPLEKCPHQIQLEFSQFESASGHSYFNAGWRHGSRT